MINNPVFFYISSFLLIIFAFLALFQKNLIYSLLAAIMVFFSGALFFYILGSEYNAIIQAAVYGLAVPVIIGLSIMLTTNSAKEVRDSSLNYLTLICGGIFLLAFIYAIRISLVISPYSFSQINISFVNHYDNISAFAKGIFINYVWAFELTAILLTIVIAGFSIIRKRGI